uniref:Uncharacterized protein AlNc14C47G3803 n=1 Tax=Albugo laibachii Nc14 TaxID=890382 RepID=F0WAU1_9STRA|nr:conserved hypothetical protein [Albugo laibachii Nc14]|eukprot:CCA18263.1 conserved hypothetical protein [Albugo laibachii Nc14]
MSNGEPNASDGLDKSTPPHLKLLATFFYALEFAMHALELYQQKTQFTSLKRSIEDSCKRTFTMDHLKQIYSIIPEAYCMYMERCGSTSDRSNSLVIKRKTIGVEDGETSSSRIDLFNFRVNHIVKEQLSHLRKQNVDEELLEEAMKEFEIQRGQLPIMRNSISESITLGTKPSAQQQPDDLDEELARVLARPVPQALQSLPTWLIDKVRKEEVSHSLATRKCENAVKKRIITTLPKLCDVLQGYAMVSRKSIFLMDQLVLKLVGVPLKDRLTDQIYLLDIMIPFWLNVISKDGKEYVKLNEKAKYKDVKTAIRKAVLTSL